VGCKLDVTGEPPFEVFGMNLDRYLEVCVIQQAVNTAVVWGKREHRDGVLHTKVGTSEEAE
jgi:hypothetical protein